jgi:hypothetical protein
LRSGITTKDPPYRQVDHDLSRPLPQDGSSSYSYSDREPPKEDKGKRPMTEDPEIPLPFPGAVIRDSLRQKKGVKNHEDLVAMFKEVHIQVPLLDAIDHIPAIVRFFKDYCTPRRQQKKGTKPKEVLS